MTDFLPWFPTLIALLGIATTWGAMRVRLSAAESKADLAEKKIALLDGEIEALRRDVLKRDKALPELELKMIDRMSDHRASDEKRYVSAQEFTITIADIRHHLDQLGVHP